MYCAPLGQSVDVEIERCIKARPIVECNLQDENPRKQRQRHTREQDAPERHQEIEPDQDHHEVELVLCISEKEDARQCRQWWETHPIYVCVMEEIEERPYEVGDHDRASAPHKEIAIGEWSSWRLTVKETERRDKEKNRYGKARTDVKKRHKMNVGRWIRKVLCADVNANHAHHGDAADCLDSGDPRPLTR